MQYAAGKKKKMYSRDYTWRIDGSMCSLSAACRVSIGRWRWRPDSEHELQMGRQKKLVGDLRGEIGAIK